MVMVVRDHSLTTFSKLHKVMGLTEDKMIASMDVKRGQMLLDDILNGGNFGALPILSVDERHGY